MTILIGVAIVTLAAIIITMINIKLLDLYDTLMDQNKRLLIINGAYKEYITKLMEYADALEKQVDEYEQSSNNG